MARNIRLPIWTIPLALAGVIALLGWWGNQRLAATVNEELRADLAATLDANVTALEIWATNQMKLATALADEPSFRSLALRALQTQSHESAEDLGEYLRLRLEGLGYGIAHLVNSNFVVVASSRRGRPRAEDSISAAHIAKFSELFSLGQPVVITPFRPRRRAPRAEPGAFAGEFMRFPGGQLSTNFSGAGQRVDSWRTRQGDVTLMQVAAPIRDDSGRVCGALALVINPDQEFTRILSVARAGKSGETYVFDQNGLLLSRSRFEQQLKQLGLLGDRPEISSAAGLRLIDPGPWLGEGTDFKKTRRTGRPLIGLVARAVAGGSGVDLEPSRDYRGIPVVGAWRWLPQQGFGVATQLDASEAFRPLRVLDLLFVMLFLLVLLCATGMFVFSFLGDLWKRRLTEAEVKLKQLGQYTLGEKIGEGAMGTVYRARHALLRRETAIKLLLPERADAVSVKRFEREVCLTSQLSHPNTIQVYDYGHTPDGVFYYAMELLEGLNLYQLVKEFGPQPEGRVVYILGQICDALAEAHALGLVHRDIKPSNIYLCNRGGVADWVKVLDFGLVRTFRDSKKNQSATHARAEGTPLFMPPEAFRNALTSDPRSDIYSLGALGYFLVTAEYVFAAESDQDLFQMHQSRIPTPPSRRTSNPVSPELEETLLRCLEKEPNLRPQSVGELHGLLRTSPAADEWTPAARTSWWSSFLLRGTKLHLEAAVGP